MHTLYDQIKLEYMELSANINILIDKALESGSTDLTFTPIKSDDRDMLYFSVKRGKVIQEYKLPILFAYIRQARLNISSDYKYIDFLRDLNTIDSFFIYIKRAGYFGRISLFTPEFEYILNAHKNLRRLLTLLDKYVGSIDE